MYQTCILKIPTRISVVFPVGADIKATCTTLEYLGQFARRAVVYNTPVASWAQIEFPGVFRNINTIFKRSTLGSVEKIRLPCSYPKLGCIAEESFCKTIPNTPRIWPRGTRRFGSITSHVDQSPLGIPAVTVLAWLYYGRRIHEDWRGREIFMT